MTITSTLLPRHDSRLARLQVHDERSRDFPFKTPPDFQRVTVRHKSHIGVMNQRRLGSCTAHAGVKELSHDPFYSEISSLVVHGQPGNNEHFTRGDRKSVV